MTSPIVKTYVDAAIDQLRRLDLLWHPKLPDAMRDESVPRSSWREWQPWKPIPSTVTDAELDALEREARLLFPPLYRDFLQYLHFVDLTESGVRFEQHLPNKWADKHRFTYLHCRDRIMDEGLLPFGWECFADAGVVCFDTNRRNEAGDCPIVYWDHGWVGTDKEVGLMFSSAAKMFECLLYVASNDLGFFSHDHEEDDPALLPKKQLLLAEFLRLDPDGAGGPGRDYWTCWGVTLAD